MLNNEAYEDLFHVIYGEYCAHNRQFPNDDLTKQLHKDFKCFYESLDPNCKDRLYVIKNSMYVDKYIISQKGIEAMEDYLRITNIYELESASLKSLKDANKISIVHIVIIVLSSLLGSIGTTFIFNLWIN